MREIDKGEVAVELGASKGFDPPLGTLGVADDPPPPPHADKVREASANAAAR